MSWSSKPCRDRRGLRDEKARRRGGLSLKAPAGACSSRLGQMALGLFDDRGERGRLMDGEFGQDLAVDFDPGRGQPGDEAAIGQAVLAHGGVDALDPQRAEFALAVLAVAIGVLHRLFDRLLGDADSVLATAKIALGGAQSLLVLGVSGYAAFDARHDDLLGILNGGRAVSRWAGNIS